MQTISTLLIFHINFKCRRFWESQSSQALAGDTPLYIAETNAMDFRVLPRPIFEGCWFRSYTFDHHDQAYEENLRAQPSRASKILTIEVWQDLKIVLAGASSTQRHYQSRPGTHFP